MSVLRSAVPCLLLALQGLPAAAELPGRPIREAFVVETDPTAEKKLAAVADYVAQEQWEAAVSLLREVSTARPDALVRVSPGRSLALSRYCDLLLSRLPQPALEVYRRGADPQAAAWLAEAEASGDERAFRSVAERAFVSSSADDALARLAERNWERGAFDRARRDWTLLVPLATAADLKPPDVLRYPDSDLDLKLIRARLVLCSIASGEYRRAEAELASFRALHAGAAGRLAGRVGPYVELLGKLLDDARGDSDGNARFGWDILPPADETRTFGQVPNRAGVLTSRPPAGPPSWFRPLPTDEFITDSARPALPTVPPLCYYPVLWRDKAFVASAERVYGFEVATGKAAWGIADDDPGILYPPAIDLDVEDIGDGRRFAANPLAGVPRHTLTIAGDRLFARLGPPVTSWSARELRRAETTIVCLDLRREGLLVWSVSSDSLGDADDWWAFEGPPVADGGRLYLLASRSRPQSQLNAFCLDAATGAVVWNRPVGAPIASPSDGTDVMTHRLATVAAGRVYVQTNHGAILCLDAADGRPVWAGWYESEPAAALGANLPERNFPAACLFSGGVLVAAPSDSDRLFAYDAESGVNLWTRDLRGGGRELLGARDGTLVVSGERLWGLDLFTGRELWSFGYEDPAGHGAGQGLLAGRLAIWPTREDLIAVNVESGQPVRRIPLKQAYGFSGGANLAASPTALLLARPDGLLKLGPP